MSYNGDDLVKFGQIASVQFYVDGAPLTDTVIKLAEQHDLSPEQIKRVCHSANQAVMLQIYKSASDNTQEFKLASAKEVMEALNKTDMGSAPISLDYTSPPPATLTSALKVASDDSESYVKVRERRLGLEKQAMLLERQYNNAADDVFMSFHKYASAIDTLAEVIAQAKNKGIEIADMLRAALTSMPGQEETVKKVMEEATQKASEKNPGLLSQIWSGISGLFKSGSQVDPSLISDKLQAKNSPVPVRIINGDNRYFSTLKTVIKARESLKKDDRTAKDISNRLEVVRKELGAAKEKEGKLF